MHAPTLPRSIVPILQASLVLIGVAALALWPPREGAMMLVALDGRDAGRLVGPALDAGAALAARGPLSNTIVVTGVRRRLTPLAWHGVILIAAPRGLCGAETTA
ncbi:hypothetical protein [Sphingomonas sp.]|jgi:hypothetical protein|uniref:hypothetical protein n=1 Tax=Sphingomonas sp. TaxID=28214 RepID=UPI003BABD287